MPTVVADINRAIEKAGFIIVMESSWTGMKCEISACHNSLGYGVNK